MTALTTVAAVREFLGLAPAADPELTPVVEAVVALVESYHDAPDEGADWPANLRQGSTMLAARIHRRRHSPAGVESLGELGPVYVSRNDPDLAQLLKIGRYAPPRVG